jgi:hypothetical protein
MAIKEAILVGVGSVGKSHFQHLIQRYNKITLVDPKIEKIKKDLEKKEGTSLEFKNSIHEISFVNESTLVVIANWGPSHYEVFKYFTKLGVKHFIIEKPLTDSLKDLSSMRRYQKKYKLQIITHIPILSAKFIKYLEVNETIIGKPIAINIFGGAKCIATNGIHYIALANKLFMNRPIEVGGYMHSDPINPREIRFKFFEGSVFWRYPERKYLNISFSNSSQINLKIEILYKYAKAEIYDNNFILTKLTDIEVASLYKPSSTRYPTNKIYEGDAYEYKIENNETSEIYNMLQKDNVCNAKDYGFDATEDLISGIISNRIRKRIILPLGKLTKLLYFNKKWSIS